MSKWTQMKHVKKHRSVGKRVRHNKKSVMERRRLRRKYYKDMVQLALDNKLTDKELKELRKSSEFTKFYRQRLQNVEKVVDRIVDEYGETLQMLGNPNVSKENSYKELPKTF